MTTSAPGALTRRETAAVTVSFLVASALGLALLVLVARWLTPAQNATFLALWGLLFAVGSVLGSVEQELVRTATHATLDGHKVPRVALQIVAATMLPALVGLVVLMVTPTGRSLITGSWWVALVACIAVGGFGAQVLSRAVFLGAHDLRRYLIVLVGEASIRLVVVGVVLVADVNPSGVVWAVIIVSGCLSWLPVVMPMVRRVDWSGAGMQWRKVGGTVAALALANGCAALVLTGFPAVATVVIGNAEQMGDLFAVVTLSRVPLVLLNPVLALAVPLVVRWMRTGQSARLRRALWSVTGASVLAAVVAGIVGYELGPSAIHVVMGSQYEPGPWMCAVVLAATCVLAGGLLHAAILVALQRYWRLTFSWAAAVAIAVLLMAFLPGTPEERGLWGFVGASVVAALATRLALRGGVFHPGDVVA